MRGGGDSHAQEALVEGSGEEGVQEVLMDQGQTQDTPAETEPEEENHSMSHGGGEPQHEAWRRRTTVSGLEEENHSVRPGGGEPQHEAWRRRTTAGGLEEEENHSMRPGGGEPQHEAWRRRRTTA